MNRTKSWLRLVVVASVVSLGAVAHAQEATLVISCDAGQWAGFTVALDGQQSGAAHHGSARLERLAPGRHLIKIEVWTSPFKRAVWYDGTVDLRPNHELRAKVTPGKFEVYGQSQVEPPPPPPPPAEPPPPPPSVVVPQRIHDALREVADRARGTSRDCRRIVIADLDELQERLSNGRLRGALRRLRALQGDAANVCPEPIQRGLARFDRMLSEFMGGRDDDWGGPPPIAAPPPVRDCWNRADPGCTATKGGNPPMGGAAYAGFQRALDALKPNVFQMLDVTRAQLAQSYLTSMQLQAIVRAFKPHVFQQLDVVRVGAPRLVDPQNGMGIAAELEPHKFQVRDAAQIIGAQRAD